MLYYRYQGLITFFLHCFQQLLPAADALEQLVCPWQCLWSTGKCHCSGPHCLLLAHYLCSIGQGILGTDVFSLNWDRLLGSCYQWYCTSSELFCLIHVRQRESKVVSALARIDPLQYQVQDLSSLVKDAIFFPCWTPVSYFQHGCYQVLGITLHKINVHQATVS